MDEDRLTLDLAGLAYEAAAGDAPWAAFGAALRGATGARSISLWAGRPAEGEVEILLTEALPDACRQAYASHYVRMDPWTQALASGAAGVFMGHEVISDGSLKASEFYRDFARGIGLFHLIGHVGVLGGGVVMPLGLHRPEDARPFTERERRVLAGVMPHLRRAVAIHRRLRPAPGGLAEAALMALPLAALVLDAGLRVLLANPAALALARGGLLPTLGRLDGPAGAGPALRPCGPRAPGLLRQVQGVAAGLMPGASLRWTGPEGQDTLLSLLPVPRALVAGRVRPGAVLLLARPLAAPPQPPARLLQAVFGMTEAEAAVALAMAAGQAAGEVAAARGVAVSTIRSQARSALEKAGAANLRGLAALLAGLSPA